jgi:glycosyltransferase involved in cell wall biosynthesis
VREIRGAIERILADADLRERLRAAGAKRSELFSWERTARETRDILRELAAARARRR